MPAPTTPKKIYQDADIDPQPLLSRHVVMLGYGNQGRPQALNLRDSGAQVQIAARPDSTKRAQAEADGFTVLSYEEALAWGDVIMCLLPDEVVADVYNQHLAPHMRPGQYLGFGHGLAVSAGWVNLDPGINVFLVAPKGQGRGVRGKYEQGSGVPALVGVHQDPSGDTEAVALAYARAIGCGRAGIFPATFREETNCDLFTEQTVLCGGLSNLITTAFETLTERGYSPEVAYFECLYEVKLIADLLHERGIAGMRKGISSTALYGDLSRGPRVIDGHVREQMRKVLDEIESGQFASEMRAEFAAGRPMMRSILEKQAQHPIEAVHKALQERLEL